MSLRAYSKINRGFTLIETLIALMLLAIVTSIGLRIYWDWFDTPLFDKKTQVIMMIQNGMKLYKLDNGFYPTTEQGISALVTKPTTKPIPQHWTPYLKKIPLDQKGNPYKYINYDDEIAIYSTER
jgi:general secretion pathway protein G